MADCELDYGVLFECGCKVIFDVTTGYHTSRLDTCEQHNKRNQIDERTEMIDRARKRMRDDLENRTTAN
jgi:hypothetical protein